MTIGQCVLQFIGFLLQTIPIAFLCLVPFKDEVFRFPRKIVLAYFCVSLTCLPSDSPI